jgi:hypothetical protein
MTPRIQIWITLLEIVSLFLVMPHLTRAPGLHKARRALDPVAARLVELWRFDPSTSGAGHWLTIGAFLLAGSWLLIAVELKVRWYLIAPAALVVLAPAIAMTVHALAGDRPERRFGYFVAGGLTFLLAKLIMLGSLTLKL